MELDSWIKLPCNLILAMYFDPRDNIISSHLSFKLPSMYVCMDSKVHFDDVSSHQNSLFSN